MRYMFFVILIIGFASAVDVEFDCPNDIYVDEEFECSLEIFDGDGVYDVKVEVDKERNSVLKIWDEAAGDWKSGYYYLNGFAENGDKKELKLKISEGGRYDVILKLRQGDVRKDFSVGEISVEESEEEDIPDVPAVSEIRNEEVKEDVTPVYINKETEIIQLGGESVPGDEEWDYVSKDGRVIDWLPYAICLFLIFLVGVLMWERF